jgi:hypothetical protein
MRIDGTRLNPKDSYESEWIGSQLGPEIRLGGDGRQVVGILGRAGQVIDALGLVQVDVELRKEGKKP